MISFPKSKIISKGIDDDMKALIQTHKEGKYFVAEDIITNIADQGLTEEEAISNLKKGLEEHYQIIIELAPRDLRKNKLQENVKL